MVIHTMEMISNGKEGNRKKETLKKKKKIKLKKYVLQPETQQQI